MNHHRTITALAVAAAVAASGVSTDAQAAGTSRSHRVSLFADAAPVQPTPAVVMDPTPATPAVPPPSPTAAAVETGHPDNDPESPARLTAAVDETGTADPFSLSESDSASTDVLPDSMLGEPVLIAPPRPRFLVNRGDTLRATIERWAEREGFSVWWESPAEFPIVADADIQAANLRDAIIQVLKPTHRTDYPLIAREKSNRVLVITAPEEHR